jgi:catechol 2,3-dioxygenase-like lactoylglutathione lyase family enzyme
VAELVARISVVYLYVRDLDRSVAFYRDVLGIPLERGGDWAEATFRDGVRFALHLAHGEEELGAGTARIDFEVADLDEAIEALRSAGVEVGEIEREVWGSACEFVDPDGYRLHLFQPPIAV